MSEFLEHQVKVIVSLLARSTIGVDRIEQIVRSGKKKGNPDDFVLAYNALDGSKTGGQLAQIVGITQQAMSAVLQTWEKEGIVYKIEDTDRYVGLLKLPAKPQRPSREKRNSKPIKQKHQTRDAGDTSVLTAGDRSGEP